MLKIWKNGHELVVQMLSKHYYDFFFNEVRKPFILLPYFARPHGARAWAKTWPSGAKTIIKKVNKK